MNKIRILLITISCAIFPLVILSAQAPKVLSELSKLKAENLKLLSQLTQCQISLLDGQTKQASQDLTARRNLLEDQFKLELNCKAGFDWQLLKCEEADVKKDSNIK